MIRSFQACRRAEDRSWEADPAAGLGAVCSPGRRGIADPTAPSCGKMPAAGRRALQTM